MEGLFAQLSSWGSKFSAVRKEMMLELKRHETDALYNVFLTLMRCYKESPYLVKAMELMDEISMHMDTVVRLRYQQKRDVILRRLER